ncbi:sensory box histidine kinase [Formosa agariphila KMM 3901]|uniref:histidine kinase n=1 Tax=Formosa agariphila (strain DSM 15362 / KCTC 12365 / LMG 23005 / KMM 3901 / M-2Alg 35-1) TaxID=1347342 RepID=T2KQT6_FORAG|nr:tetratricopeptide repeat-containing sensor histidine kinase [Formosa agariphila]CDF80868.1 sensory box histidine kinase [Formosa agariphila KMM 3901]
MYFCIYNVEIIAQNKTSDSIENLLLKSTNPTEFSFESRFLFAKQAQQYSNQLKLDSLSLISTIQIARLYEERGIYDLFLSTSHKNLREAKRLGDSLSMATVNHNIANYYFKRSVDSAYNYFHKAEKIYRALNDDYNTASTLLGIAVIQKNEKDFIGSEVTSVEGITLLDNLPDSEQVTRKKAYLYNNLGLVFDQLEQFDDAINYHNKSLELKRSLKGDNSETINNSKNNLALAYKNSGAYSIALNYYEDILSNKSLKKKRPDIYALVLDNYAHTQYLNNDEDQVLKLYLEALHICDSINSSYNSIMINQHLAEFYNDRKQMDSARYYAYNAKELSKDYHNDDFLESLLLLSRIEVDSIAVKHYKDYIHLNDSLQKSERNVRNKFARIRYETKEIELKNKKITQERLSFMLLSVGLLLTSFLIIVIISQRNKNKSLQFKQRQQQANEEIYNLMLSQQDKVDEARTLEKRRISEELHDGILGRLFGTRLSLDSLNASKTNDAIETRSNYIDELKSIEAEIRKVSHDLNTDFVSNSGYIDIVKTLLEKQSIAYDIKCDLKYEDNINWEDISNKTKIHFYRIIQEALQNTYKHAKADYITIDFYKKDDDICLDICDNGVGFDLSKSKKGIGLKNMSSRVNEIEGFLTVKSNINEGTKISIRTPLNN